jgi:mono/diheme cytochrome c family protein
MLVVRARLQDSDKPRISIIPDMDQQGKYMPQGPGPLFADGRAMRPEIPGTVPRGRLMADSAFYAGKQGEDWIAEIPMALDSVLLARGRERFNIYCAPCHGYAGQGDGMIAKRADKLQEGTWTPPTSLHTDLVRSRPAGHLFNTISRGIRNMPAYGPQIGERDRWCIVAYIRALQLSQNAGAQDVPADQRAALGIGEEGGR